MPNVASDLNGALTMKPGDVHRMLINGVPVNITARESKYPGRPLIIIDVHATTSGEITWGAKGELEFLGERQIG